MPPRPPSPPECLKADLASRRGPNTTVNTGPESRDDTPGVRTSRKPRLAAYVQLMQNPEGSRPLRLRVAALECGLISLDDFQVTLG